MREEVMAFPESEWRQHPTEFDGNTALLLVSVDGGQNDYFSIAGQMRATPALQRSPYLRQVMATVGVPVSRSRLMRIDPGQKCPWHDDVGFHWYRRIRIHVPIVTTPEVRFHCGSDSVHMAAGEAWVFDNFERHCVVNSSDIKRIHFVFDVPGMIFLTKHWNHCIPISRRDAWPDANNFRFVPYQNDLD